jgi:hypothetical protein
MGWREKSMSIWAFLFIVETNNLIAAAKAHEEKYNA